MTTHSVSKVKVALGISNVILIIYLFSSTAYAQTLSEDLLQKKITLTCQNTHFEEVLEQLTRQTNLHFIYSSSMVTLNRSVTFSVREFPLKNVLDLISRQMGITFKRQGNYFVIKKNVDSKITTNRIQSEDEQPETGKLPQGENNLASSSNPENYHLPSQRFRVHAIDSNLETKDNALNTDLLYFGPGLASWDTAVVLKYLPLLLNEKITYRHQRKWFVSAGAFVNGYSTGIETQIGIRALYAVANASLLGNGLHRFGYGLGTAVPMKPGVSANLAYTFASMRQKEYEGAGQSSYQSVSQHHQVRLLAVVSLFKHFSAFVGPSFNFLATYHYVQEPTAGIMVVKYNSAAAQNYTSSGRSGYVASNANSFPVLTTDYRTRTSWVSFEAGVSYRINFSLDK